MSNLPQRSTPHLISQAYSNLIGIPYETQDCWGIIRLFYKQVFNVELKQYYELIPETKEEAKSIVLSCVKDFREVVGERKIGDLLLIRIYGVESHIAVYIGQSKILHTTKHSGCVIDSIARWEKMIVGTYRVKDYDLI
jgi:cell wall-associated NlpC family hydrolase